MKRPIGVLVSGAGSNLRALCEAAADEDFPASVELVISNRRTAGALAIAAEYSVPAQVFSLPAFGGDGPARDRAMREALVIAGVDLVVCAGYNRVLSDDFLDGFPGAILNIHPSLLPEFGGGMNAIEDALAAGAQRTGCTVHYLEPGETDGGAIIASSALDVAPDDTADSLRERVHRLEWELLPRVVSLWCEGRLLRNGATVTILEKDEVRAT